MTEKESGSKEVELASNEERIKNAERFLEIASKAYDSALEVNRRCKSQAALVLAAGATAISIFGSQIENISQRVLSLIVVALFFFVIEGLIAVLIWLPYKSKYPVSENFKKEWKFFVYPAPETALAHWIEQWQKSTSAERTRSNILENAFVGLLVVATTSVVMLMIAFVHSVLEM